MSRPPPNLEVPSLLSVALQDTERLLETPAAGATPQPVVALAAELLRCEVFAAQQPADMTAGAETRLAWARLIHAWSQQPHTTRAADWLGITKRLQGSGVAFFRTWPLEAALVHLAPLLGDRGYLCAVESLDRTQRHARTCQLRLRLGGRAAEIATSLGATVARLENQPVDAEPVRRLTARLQALFENSAREPVADELTGQCEFVVRFLKQIVAEVDLGVGAWEQLLVRLDDALQNLAAGGPAGVDAMVEPLIAAIPTFPFLAALMRAGAALPAGRAQIVDLVALHGVLAQHPGARLARDWRERFAAPMVRAVGLRAQHLSAVATGLAQGLRDTWERHHLDLLDQAASELGAWLQADEALQQAVDAQQERIARLVSLLVEGTSDTAGEARLRQQLATLWRLGLQARLRARDGPHAREMLRRAVALGLDLSTDPLVWKRYREISAALAAFEVDDPWLRPRLAGVRLAAPDLEAILGDQLRHPVRWAPSLPARPAPAEPRRALEPGLLDAILCRAAAARRLHGRAADHDALGRWWLDAVGASAVVPADELVAALDAALPADALPGSVPAGLASWLPEIAHWNAMRTAWHDAEAIADMTVKLGGRMGASSRPMALAPADEAELGFGARGVVWLLRRLVLMRLQPLAAEAWLAWWWAAAHARRTAQVPHAPIRDLLQGLEQALQFHVSGPSAARLMATVRQLFRRVYGIPGRTDGDDNARFRPVAAGPWPPEPAGLQADLHPLGPHAALLRDAAPTSLQPVLEGLVARCAAWGDEEQAWASRMPALHELLARLGPSGAEACWMAWKAEVGPRLPTGAALVFHAFALRGWEVLRQVAAARFIARHLDILARHGGPAHRPTETGRELWDAAAARELLRSLSELLGREAPSAAALDTGRAVLHAFAGRPAARGSTWRRLVLVIEALGRRHGDPTEQQALYRWGAQWMALSAQLEAAAGVMARCLPPDVAVFSEDPDDETAWRDGVESLLAAAMTPDHAPVPGTAVLSRAFSACAVFQRESTASWPERQQALASLFGDAVPPAFAELLTRRQVQLARQMHEAARVREFGALLPLQKASVAMSGSDDGGSLWWQADAARRIDAITEPVPADVRFMAELTRTDPVADDALQDLRQRGQLATRHQAPAQLGQRRLFRRRVFELDATQRQALHDLTLHLLVTEFSSPRLRAAQRAWAVGRFATLPGDGADPLACWLDGLRREPAICAAAGGIERLALLREALEAVRAGERLRAERQAVGEGRAHADEDDELVLLGSEPSLLAHFLTRECEPAAGEPLPDQVVALLGGDPARRHAALRRAMAAE